MRNAEIKVPSNLKFYWLDTLRYYIPSAGIISRLFIIERNHAGLTRVSLAAIWGSMRQVIRGESVYRNP